MLMFVDNDIEVQGRYFMHWYSRFLTKETVLMNVGLSRHADFPALYAIDSVVMR